MLFPRTGSEISSEWLQMVVESYEKSKRPLSKVLIESFHANKGTNPGENYNSELIRVEAKGKIQTEEQTEDIHYDLILKFHSLSLFSKEVNIFNKNHIKELDIYCNIHKELTELQEKELNNKYKLNIPELIYGHNEGEDYVIAMRNLKPLGYTLNDKTLGLNYEQLKLAVNQIARWHALSYSSNKRSKLLDRFPQLNEGLRDLMYILFIMEMEIIIKNTYCLFVDRDEWKEFLPKLKNTNEIIKKVKNQIISKEADIPRSVYSLVHGDYWNNNLLYLYSDQERSEERNPVDISVVDWQMCHWNRCVIDLQFLLHTSTSYEIRKNHTNDLLLEYFTVFKDITSSLSTPVPEFTFESLKTDFRDSLIVGFMFGLCLAQGTLSKAGEIIHPPNNSASNVRGFAYTLKTKVARFVAPLILKPSFSFLATAAVKNMLNHVTKEVQERKNDVLLSRLLGLIQEAIDNGTLDDIKPITSSS